MESCIILPNMHEMRTDHAGERLDWARQALHRPDLILESASSDASFRSYWRTVGIEPSLIVMDSPAHKEDLGAWLGINHCLVEAGIHVPTIQTSDTERGFALIEDFGHYQYLDVLDDANVDRLYADATQTLLNMQSRVDSSCLPMYDTPFLQRELALLEPWFLQRHLGQTVGTMEHQVLDDAFGILIDNAIGQPTRFTHRDYHSRNLMVTPHNSPGVIDFQDALRGPITYDLVSLLRDCYITWDESRIDAWREDYRLRLIDAHLLDTRVGHDQFSRWFDLTGLQRHIKVLGIFCRLAVRDGKAAYLDDLPRVLDYVLRIAGRYPPLRDLVSLLQDATSGHDIRQLQQNGLSGNRVCTP